MAAAVSIARYLLNEASSGTGPTTLGDATGNGNTLTIDYSSGDASWTSITGGNALNFTATAGTANAAVASKQCNTGNLTSLNGVTEFSFIAVVNTLVTGSIDSVIFRIGDNATSTGTIALYLDSSRNLRVRLNNGTTSITAISSGSIATGSTLVICGVIDTTQATAADRCKLWVNNTALGSGQALGTQNFTPSVTTSHYFSIGNNVAFSRSMQGAVAYLELFTGQLTTQQVSDSYTALASNNDADWNATTLAWTAEPSIDQETTGGFRVSLTTNLDCTVDILVTANGTGQPSTGSFDAATFGGSSTASTVYRETITGYSDNTTYTVWVRAVNGSQTIYDSVQATTSAITNSIVSVNSDGGIKDGQQNISVVWDAGASATSITWNGVAQTGGAVIDSTHTEFDFVWPNLMFGTGGTLTIDGDSATAGPLLPADGYAVATLDATYNASATGAITATPALVAPNQLYYSTENNTVFIGPNGIPQFTSLFDGTLSVAVIDSADYSKSSFATITYDVPGDVIPDQFSLGADVTDAEPSAYTTRSFTVAGTTAGIQITFAATGVAQVSDDNSTWASSCTAALGDTVYVRVQAGALLAVVTGGCSSGGVVDSFSVTTRAASVPSISAQPGNQSVTSGGVANFSVTASGAASYQWRIGGSNIAGATSSSYARTTTDADIGTSSVDVVVTSSEGGSVTSTAATLTVAAAASTGSIVIPAGLVDGSGNSLAGQSITFNVYQSNGTFIYTDTVTIASSGTTVIADARNGTDGTTRIIGFPSATDDSEARFTVTVG